MAVYERMSPDERDHMLRSHMQGVSDVLNHVTTRLEIVEKKLEEVLRATMRRDDDS